MSFSHSKMRSDTSMAIVKFQKEKIVVQLLGILKACLRLPSFAQMYLISRFFFSLAEESKFRLHYQIRNCRGVQNYGILKQFGDPYTYATDPIRMPN